MIVGSKRIWEFLFLIFQKCLGMSDYLKELTILRMHNYQPVDAHKWFFASLARSEEDKKMERMKIRNFTVHITELSCPVSPDFSTLIAGADSLCHKW